MAYDKKKILEQAKAAIIKHKLFFTDDIIAFIPIARSTFYEWQMDKMDELKDLLEQNKTELKVSMRAKWYKSDAPVLQMALMKLISSPEEHRKLSMNHTDVTTNGEAINKPIIIDWKTDETTDENNTIPKAKGSKKNS
jgi:L-lactate utilization protein LutC